MTDHTLEDIVSILTQSKDYQILKRFERVESYHEESDEDKLIGVFLDTETTGLNYYSDKIIELALTPFEYTKDGRIFRILPSYSSFQDPGISIPEHISLLTGITNEMVRGHNIDYHQIKEVIASAAVIIAHNACFDRKFVEAQFPCFMEKPWACTYTQIPWNKENITSAKLEYLAYKFGFFYQAHRAEMDCLVGVNILAQDLPISKTSVLKTLLGNAREKSYLIWAEKSPFEAKDILKSRGYRWNDGSNQKPKAWYIEISNELKEEEMDFLYSEIYKRKVILPIDTIDAFNRFSDRQK